MNKYSCYEKYMRRCLYLAEAGRNDVAPNPMVGAVLVREGADGASEAEIVGEGWHRKWGEAHAEVNCFKDAESRGYVDFSDCTMFVSLEPCSHYGKTPPCAKLIIEKRVKRVVVGILDPNPQVSGRGVRMLREAGIDVVVGVCEQECRSLNRRFLCLQEKKRPYVILKWAQTEDGFLDAERDANDAKTRGMEIVISNMVTKQLVHQMRAANMAIMVGTRTVLLDNPKLCTTRWKGRNPIRVVLDRKGVIPADSKVFSEDAETLVYRENTDYEYVLSDLAKRGIHSLMVEGGACLLRSILQTGIWDEIQVEVAPVRIGAGVQAPLWPHGKQEMGLVEKHKIYKIYPRDLVN